MTNTVVAPIPKALRAIIRVLGVGLILVMAVSSISAAVSDDQAEKEIAAAFKQSFTEHLAAESERPHDVVLRDGGRGLSSTLRPQPWSLESGFADTSLNRSIALEGLVRRLDGITNNDASNDRARYCEAARSYLRQKQAGYRGIACEFLGHFPTEMSELDLISDVGNLLEDDAVAFGGMRHCEPQQRRTDEERWTVGLKVSVGDIARSALAAATNVRFPSQEQCLTWWGKNAAFHDRIWYWAVRWRSHASVQDMPLLEKVDPVVALKVLLLVNNHAALMTEAALPWNTADANGPPTFSPEVCYRPIDAPGTEVIADFIQNHNLKGVLFGLLSGSVTWPELQRLQLARMLFVSKISDLSNRVLVQADAVVLEEILNKGEGLLAKEPRQQAMIALLAAQLDPERHDEIILSQLKRNPAQAALAADLIQRTGLDHWGEIKAAFGSIELRERGAIITTLGLRKDPGVRRALGELISLQDLAAHGAQRGNSNAFDNDMLFREFVAAAQAVNSGQAVVDNDLSDRACFLRASKMNYDDRAREHDAAVPIARAQALEKLRQFFSERDQP